MSNSTDTSAPEGIDAAGVTAWFEANVPDARPPFSFELITGGRSNLTFRVTDAAGQKFVLRRPPLGHVLESAHDMGREHRIISALGPTDVPVAPALGLCKDESVNGADFYVMKFVEGEVLDTKEAASTWPEDNRRALGLDIIDVLARLHGLEPDDIGLGDLGRKEAYVARQLRRWRKQYEATQTDDIPEMAEVSRLLEEQMPEQVGASVVHGDYRLGNFMVADSALRAVLDWELCTLGDPLADVGYLLNDWRDAADIAANPEDIAPAAAGGFPARAELVDRYAAATGRDLSNINYYRSLAHWRLAAIGQGVYFRYLKGAMGQQDVDLTPMQQGVVLRAQAALALIG